jgi:hypothetical protein
MPRRSNGLTRYLRDTAMSVSRNVQDLFGTTEAAVVTQPDPTPNREDSGRSGQHSSAERRRSSKGDRLPPRERRGRD